MGLREEVSPRIATERFLATSSAVIGNKSVINSSVYRSDTLDL